MPSSESSQERDELIRQAVRAARQREYEIIREAYLKEPDCDTPDDWSNTEEWKP